MTDRELLEPAAKVAGIKKEKVVVKYDLHTDEFGEPITCHTCGAESPTHVYNDNGNCVHMCPFCYETLIGMSILCNSPNALQVQMLAQSMNVLLRLLKEG